jgi:radical SAM protein with 4Fe4S-binding SPASM domain
LIRETAAFIERHPSLQKRGIRYSISTNGTLLTREVIDFLDSHRFRVNLSYDGLAQEMTRPSGMNSLLLGFLDRMIGLKGIELETNSVFIPSTAGEVFGSARLLVESGVKNCHLTYSIIHPWDSASLNQLRNQVRELREFLVRHYLRSYTIPIENFRSRPVRSSLFWCSAGQDRLALAADGRLWGCRFFADFFAENPGHRESDQYCFGDIEELEKRSDHQNRTTWKTYRRLRQDGFSSEHIACRECDRLLSCRTCPAAAAFAAGDIGRVPTWMCDINRLWREEVGKFWMEVDKS